MTGWLRLNVGPASDVGYKEEKYTLDVEKKSFLKKSMFVDASKGELLSASIVMSELTVGDWP